jgi:lon-related putative ATP-dependent protease
MMRELSVEELYRVCDPDSIPWESSQEVNRLEAIVGQDRAVKAMKFGLGIKDKGFNIYVSGVPGTGRTTAIKQFIEEIAAHQPAPPDWCYVNNFQDSAHPNAIQLPAGRAVEFQKDMEALGREAIQAVRNAFESDEYSSLKEQTVQGLQERKAQILERVNEQARQADFLLQASPMGLMTIPLRDGKPLEEKDFMQLSQAEKDEIVEKRQRVQELLQTALRQGRAIDREAATALQKMDREVAGFAISQMIEEMQEKYQDVDEVGDYIAQVRDDILDNLALVKEEDGEEPAQPAAPLPPRAGRKPLLKKYSVNVLVDHSQLKGAPVVVELNPTHPNLFGKIEQEAQFGALVTDFTLIRCGSLHLANGGYLVLPLTELLNNPFAWDSLKRALANQKIVVEEIAEKLGFATRSLRPEPIPLNVKVVLIGLPHLFSLLQKVDEQFDELFKVKADFDTVMARTSEHTAEYVAFASTLCDNNGLKHLDRGALARVVEAGSRIAEDQSRLTTRFRDLSDIIHEANYYAGQEGASLIGAAHIRKALSERYDRSSLVKERICEMIQRGVLKIDSRGEKTGQVNGLSVFELDDIAFGQPNRITVSVALGREGLVNIEREAKLSGPIHTKGVMILSGYLAEKFAQDKPLSLSARLVFEQSYSGVEGDSASSTELYALLSALSRVPIRQSIAVTGSVNQKGEVQAIGGVNAKIEGYFDVCQALGLNGAQGVMIPESNTPQLMLKDEVLEAVRQGKFHVWAVSTIEEGIQVLTGVPAGKRLESGAYEEGSVFARVDQRLRDMAKKISEFGREKPVKEDQPAAPNGQG